MIIAATDGRSKFDYVAAREESRLTLVAAPETHDDEDGGAARVGFGGEAALHVDSPDAALVAAAKAGDRRAFGWLYLRYARLAHGILLSRVPPSDADDLTHDVFAHALGRLKQLRDDKAFSPWLCAISRRFAADFLRRRRRSHQGRRRWISLLHPAEATETRHESPGSATAAEEILAIIRNLPETYGETLTLRLVEGMGGPEIARRTGLTEGSVRVNLHRGMKLLRQRLQKEGWS